MHFHPWSPLHHHFSCFCLLIAQTFFVDGRVYCSARFYGSPDSVDCSAALLNLPGDTADRWFLEQQLRTALPTADWRSFVDGRSPALWQPVVQLQKWWSHSQSSFLYLYPSCWCRWAGTCNIALVMYGHLHLVVPVAFLKWSDIRNLGYQVAWNCVENSQQGGAGEIFSMW